MLIRNVLCLSEVCFEIEELDLLAGLEAHRFPGAHADGLLAAQFPE
jgi:hypothetical protein